MTFLDITAPEVIEIEIRDDGKVIWVHTQEGTVLRVCRIGKLILTDHRG